MTEQPMSLDERANVDFVLYLRRRWADVVYPALKDQFDDAVSGRDAASEADVAGTVHGLPVYPWFAWLERGSQKMLWRAVSDFVAAHPPDVPDEARPAEGLDLNPGLELPGWYTGWDIHVQPGGVWRNGAAARVYEQGAKLVMMGDNDDYGFHQTFTQTVIPERPYRRIVDLGCGFGKSTWPLKQAFPEAEVIGVELSAPCLRMAHGKVTEMGLDVGFRQADACATGLEDESCDLVTSTMVIHEIPEDVLPAFFAEAGRILAPGGIFRVLDFQKTGQPVRDLVLEEHGARNNEPFMPPMMNADIPVMCEKAGLSDAHWVAFDERGTGPLNGLNWPDRAEWHFPWAVLEAEKPL